MSLCFINKDFCQEFLLSIFFFYFLESCVPLLNEWLADGMSMGSAAAFMLTGPATKITNLGAVKIVLGWKRFLIYLAFVMLFSLCTGLIVDVL